MWRENVGSALEALQYHRGVYHCSRSAWITEWSLNVNGDYSVQEPRAYGTWAEGLFCAELALLFSETPRIGE